MLQQHFCRSGDAALLVRDPGTTRIGEQLRGILLDAQNTDMSMRCEMLLYMAARAQMMSQVILPALAEGRMVIADRFISSTLAYQANGEGLTQEQIAAVGDVAIQQRWPDMTIILDISPQHSFARLHARAKDRIEQRPQAYHEQVRRNYLLQAEQHPHKYRVVDAGQSVNAIHAEILELVKSLRG